MFNTKFKRTSNKISLSKSFYVFSGLICGLMILILGTAFVYLSYKESKKIGQDLVIEAQIASNAVREFARETTNLAEFLARKIQQEPDNLDFINLLFKRKFAIDISLNEDKLIHWPTFKWADKDSNILVSSTNGILKSSQEEHLIPSKYANNYEAWQPIYGYGVYDNKTSLNIVMTDDAENHIGTLITYIDLSKMVGRVKSSFGSEDILFVLLNAENEIIASTKTEEDIPSDYFKYKIGNVNFIKESSGLFKRAIPYANKIFLSYSKVPDTPFRIVIGKAKGELYYSFYNIILYGVVFITIVLFSMIVSLYYMYVQTIRPVKMITQAGRDIISKGDFSQLPPHNSSKEIFKLCQVMIRFKSCKNKLENSYKEISNQSSDLSKINKTLECNIRSFEASDVNLVSFKEKLNCKRNAQIQNSLNGILSVQNMVADTNFSSGDILEVLDIVYKNIQHSNECILPRLSIEKFSVYNALNEATELLARSIIRSGANVIVNKNSNTIEVEDDILCFQQLYIAILSLTLYFVDSDNKIEILASEQEDCSGKYINVSIIDDGCLNISLRKDFVKDMKQNALLFECKYDIEKLIEQAKENNASLVFEELDKGVKANLKYYLAKDNSNDEICNNILLFKSPKGY